MASDDLKIPVLMYHEVSSGSPAGDKTSRMTPRYVISTAQFESQMRLLAENGYRSIFFEDVLDIKKNGKYVIITFDDGLQGNYMYALPILKKYGFKAVIFATVGMIDSERFMSWEDLREMVNQGMSVQSHTLSHPHLQSLTEGEAHRELYESKKRLEDKLKIKVTSMSFPHGSYNEETVRIASKTGYKYICTSEIVRNFASSFQKKPAVLGRIAITSKLSTERYLGMVEYNRKEILKEKLVKGSKNMFKRLIGSDNYGRLYRAFFKIKVS